MPLQFSIVFLKHVRSSSLENVKVASFYQHRLFCMYVYICIIWVQLDGFGSGCLDTLNPHNLGEVHDSSCSPSASGLIRLWPSGCCSSGLPGSREQQGLSASA